MMDMKLKAPVFAAVLMSLAPALYAEGLPAFAMVKDPNCGCCSDWQKIVETAGYPVTVKLGTGTALMSHKAKSGITPKLASCHTAHIEGYVVEGHVPVADVRRLLAERPDAVGLTVPGMPYGSPGMGDESKREAYEVLLIHKDGSTEVFSRYEAGS